MPHRVAFYPCCAIDILEPLSILTGIADEVIFCDINHRLFPTWKAREQERVVSQPRATFMIADARDVVQKIPAIDVLFYRRDSTSEGGSGVFVLGDSLLPIILERFNPVGGLIITDGSNSRGGNFNKMIRQSGLEKHGWSFSVGEEQPFRETVGLWVISVEPLERPDHR
jgi:hypothetical protein